MALNLPQFEMLGGLAAHYPSMAAPVVYRAVNWSRKLSSFLVRSDLSCRASLAVDKMEQVEEQDYSGTPYVPVYVMLPNWIIHPDYGLGRPSERTDLIRWLSILKSMNVDGVKVECWWGIVEPQVPKYYDWSQYKALFQIVKDLKLKLQVVLCFHACAGTPWDGVDIPLPRWVMEVGRKNPDIFFTSSNGIRNHDCLSWGIDQEQVLMNRTAFAAYRDFMISFRQELEEFVVDGFISNIEIGLGRCGELRIPSCTVNTGCRFGGEFVVRTSRGGEFPPIDEFEGLKKAWKERGASLCGVRPTTIGSYKSSPRKTKRSYFSFYGQFFLKWYSRVLVDHADKLLSLGKDTFSDYCSIAAKIPEICHLWYEPNIHVEGLIGGYYNHTKCDAPIISLLKKYNTTLNSTLPEMRTISRGKDFPEGLAEEIGMSWQLLCAARAAGIPVSVENDHRFYDRQGYHEILEITKPINNPSGSNLLSTFTYFRLSYELMQKDNLKEFGRFVQRMHGESTT